MKNISRITLIYIGLLLWTGASAQPSGKLTLQEVVDLARRQSISSRQAATTRETRYWEYRSFRSNYKPQLILNGNLPDFVRSFQQIQQPNGTIAFEPVSNNNSSLGLLLSQTISATGGTVYAAAQLQRFDDFDRKTTLYNGNPFYIGFNQPLFQFNSLKWDKQIEPLKFEESKQAYNESFEQIAYSATGRFFQLLLAQVSLQIAETNLANNDTVYQIARERYALGKASRNDMLQLELEILKSKKGVAAARQEREVAMLDLRTYIGAAADALFELDIPEAPVEMQVLPEKATQEAFANRPDALAFMRRLKEAEREVAKAKGDNGLNAQLNASFGLSNRADNLADVYRSPKDQQSIRIEFQLPIIDWGRAQARLETALANQKLTEYSLEQDKQNFRQEIYTEVTLFEMLRNQLSLAADADRIASERYQIARDRYILGDLSITDLSIALQEKDQAKQDYILSLRDFWNAYYKLRMLTLYDFVKNEKINHL